MNEHSIPEDMTQVADRVALMAARGFPVNEDDVIKEALKLGFQDIVDERMEGNYYTVRWMKNLMPYKSLVSKIHSKVRQSQKKVSPHLLNNLRQTQ